ncbi:MAG: hypothetical protein HKN88_01495 [Gammaproteobacteria bacterium]|nr:hypothetical protein [Gammaproteobacteria bacterium]NNC96723.1 hypothetical protein [Gammaproteobacteria bacterium]NNM14302.1 hypothetical protein [Gammaproteobacteria bacterium]
MKKLIGLCVFCLFAGGCVSLNHLAYDVLVERQAEENSQHRIGAHKEMMKAEYPTFKEYTEKREAYLQELELSESEK